MQAMTVPMPAFRSALQRVDGAARVEFGPTDAGSHSGITDLYQRAPCRLLFPVVEPGAFPLAVALTTSGGLTGGDRIALDVVLAPGACGTVMCQAAEKLYRAAPGDAPASLVTRIDVGARARGEWLAQEAILFDRLRLERSTEVRLAADARLIAAESLVFGRTAMGETLREGLVRDAWRVWREGRLVWADTLAMEGDLAALAAEPWGLGSARAMATLLYAGPDAAQWLDQARLLAEGEDSGATLVNGLLILRFLGADAALVRRRLTTAIGALRAAIFAQSPQLPAPWMC